MALSTGCSTPQRADGNQDKLIPVFVKNGYTLYIGGIVCSDTTGYGVPGASATGLRPIGVCREAAFGVPGESAALGSAGATGSVVANVAVGQFLLNNDTTNPLTQADLYKTCWMVDDQTVCGAGGGAGKSPLGRFTGFEQLSPTGIGCWVEIGIAVPTTL